MVAQFREFYPMGLSADIRLYYPIEADKHKAKLPHLKTAMSAPHGMWHSDFEQRNSLHLGGSLPLCRLTENARVVPE
jgi:hypothetical protein